MVRGFVVSTLAAAAVVSCAAQAPRRQASAVATDTGTLSPLLAPPMIGPRPEARHAIYAAHLREMMAELDYLAGNRLPQELEPGGKREERLEELSYTAEALAGTAADIPEILDEVRMSAEDRAYFRSLANRLRTDARELQAQAARGAIGPSTEVLSRITATCDACHKAFRVLPSVMDRATR